MVRGGAFTVCFVSGGLKSIFFILGKTRIQGGAGIVKMALYKC